MDYQMEVLMSLTIIKLEITSYRNKKNVTSSLSISYLVHEHKLTVKTSDNVVKSESPPSQHPFPPCEKFDVCALSPFSFRVIICMYVAQTHYTYFPLLLTLYFENDFKCIERLPVWSKELSHPLIIKFLIVYHIICTIFSLSPHILFLLNHLRENCIHHTHLSFHRYTSVYLYYKQKDIFLVITHQMQYYFIFILEYSLYSVFSN